MCAQETPGLAMFIWWNPCAAKPNATAMTAITISAARNRIGTVAKPRPSAFGISGLGTFVTSLTSFRLMRYLRCQVSTKGVPRSNGLGVT
jgi:hypothetical protein